MTTLAGRGGALYLAPSPTSAAVPIGKARAWRFDMTQSLIENTQGFGAIWQQFMLASTGWKGSIDGVLDTGDTTVFDAAAIPTTQGAAATYAPVACYFYPAVATPARFYAGTIWPNLSVDCRRESVIKYHCDFVGHGPLFRA